MINVLEGFADNVLAVEATGKVTDDDYEHVLVPALQDMRERQKGIRIVYVLDEEFDGWSAGAIWKDAKLGIKDFRAWEKIAIVSDNDWAQNMTTLLGWMVPGEIRSFPLTQLDEAATWAAVDGSGSDGGREQR